MLRFAPLSFRRIVHVYNFRLPCSEMSHDMEELELITTGQLANEARKAAETIRRKIDAGEIAAIRTANGYRLITRSEADRFLKLCAEERSR